MDVRRELLNICTRIDRADVSIKVARFVPSLTANMIHASLGVTLFMLTRSRIIEVTHAERGIITRHGR